MCTPNTISQSYTLLPVRIYNFHFTPNCNPSTKTTRDLSTPLMPLQSWRCALHTKNRMCPNQLVGRWSTTVGSRAVVTVVRRSRGCEHSIYKCVCPWSGTQIARGNYRQNIVPIGWWMKAEPNKPSPTCLFAMLSFLTLLGNKWERSHKTKDIRNVIRSHIKSILVS